MMYYDFTAALKVISGIQKSIEGKPQSNAHLSTPPSAFPCWAAGTCCSWRAGRPPSPRCRSAAGSITTRTSRGPFQGVGGTSHCHAATGKGKGKGEAVAAEADCTRGRPPSGEGEVEETTPKASGVCWTRSCLALAAEGKTWGSRQLRAATEAAGAYRSRGS